MNKDKSNLLDSFYNIKSEKKLQTKTNSTPNPATKVVTYSLKEDNIKYVELRATHFSSKSAFINYLIESDKKKHQDIVEMVNKLQDMKM